MMFASSRIDCQGVFYTYLNNPEDDNKLLFQGFLKTQEEQKQVCNL